MYTPPDADYFEWLVRTLVGGPNGSIDNRYNRLLRLLFNKEFVWVVPNDDNRAEDGKDIRCEYVTSHLGMELDDVDPFWLNYGCSVMEMLLALSKRLAFETWGMPKGKTEQQWFWVLIDNLGLLQNPRKSSATIDLILDRFIFRTYQPNGEGGIFPLRYPTEDQRKVELWYQMCAYVLEMDQ